MALNGPERVACECLLLGVEQTYRAGGQTSEFDPYATFPLFRRFALTLGYTTLDRVEFLSSNSNAASIKEE